MAQVAFKEFVLATLTPATNVTDGSRLSDQQKALVVDYLTSPGSGPDGSRAGGGGPPDVIGLLNL